VNPRIYQPLAKKSQSPFSKNEPKALSNQGSGRTAPSLWDGSDLDSCLRFLVSHGYLSPSIPFVALAAWRWEWGYWLFVNGY
ncbi:MAG: hypothetical protein J0M04_20565, partial [Verrucomicrobia bacterium]|nr:hypothetical protein [Verrucomicrobiota bacterium]